MRVHQERLQQLSDDRHARSANQQATDEGNSRTADHQERDLFALRAQREAHTDLLGPLYDGVGHVGVECHRGKNQRDRRQHEQHRPEDALRPPEEGQEGVQRLDVEHGQIGVERRKLGSDLLNRTRPS